MLRVVCDPKVLISARLSPRGAPAKLLSAWTDEQARAFVNALRTGAVVIDDPPGLSGVTPDPKDDYLVALARVADADRLISGDPHLTDLADADPPILPPRAFLDQLG